MCYEHNITMPIEVPRAIETEDAAALLSTKFGGLTVEKQDYVDYEEIIIDSDDDEDNSAAAATTTAAAAAATATKKKSAISLHALPNPIVSRSRHTRTGR